MLWTDSVDIVDEFVVRAGGEFLHTIIVGDEIYDEVRKGRDIVRNFLTACPLVHSVSVFEKSKQRPPVFRMQLEKLEVAVNFVLIVCEAIPHERSMSMLECFVSIIVQTVQSSLSRGERGGIRKT